MTNISHAGGVTYSANCDACLISPDSDRMRWGITVSRRSKAGVLPIELGSLKRSFADAELPLVANPQSIRDHSTAGGKTSNIEKTDE